MVIIVLGKKKRDKNISLRKIIVNSSFSFKFLWLNSKLYLFCILLNTVIGASVAPLTLLLTNKLYGLLEIHSLFSDAIVVLIGILGINAVYMGWSQLYGSCIEPSLSEKLRQKVQTGLFKKVLATDLSRYDDPEFYNDFILAMQYTDVYASGTFITAANFIGNVLNFLTTISLLAYVDISVLLILLASAVISSFISTKNNLIEVEYNAAITPINRRVQYLEGIFKKIDYSKELRLTNIYENVERDYIAAAKEHVNVTKRFGLRRIILTMFEMINTNGVYMAVIALMLYKLAVLGTVTIAGFAVVVNANWQMRSSFVSLASSFTSLPQQSMQIDKVRSFMEYRPRSERGSLSLPAPPFESIEMHNVFFGYTGGDNVLHDISFKIKRGEKISIVGYNGAGKSTLIKLIMRLYEPLSGTIMYNGRIASDYDVESYRGRIGAVFQDYRIFAATISENVLGDEFTESDRPRVLEALHRATFDDKLAALESGIDTVLTREFDDKGTNLSGGEAQKIAIARVFAGNYDLIIMDEPSASLDPIAEYELNKQIAEFASDRTVIFISHRLSTTRHADRIYMFEDGRIIEQGSHNELMRMNGKYAEMFTVQAEKYIAK